MAEFKRSIYLVDDITDGKPVNQEDVTERIDDDAQLQFVVDVALSNPLNKRYAKTYKEGSTIDNIFEAMTMTLERNQLVGLSNGTKTAYQTVENWIKVFKFNLKMWIADDKDENQNVLINVDGKNLEPEAVEIKSL